MDLAPVVDVDTNPDNPVIGDRAFSSNAEEVGILGRTFIESMQTQGGVACCAKHFPGHGDTSVDSHKDMPVVAHTWSRLEKTEMHPFKEAVRSGVASIIVGHMLIPAIQTHEEVEQRVPASMSKAVVDYLRRDLGFNGVVMTDDVEMGAVAKHFR